MPTYLASIHHDGSARFVQAQNPILSLGDEVILRLRAAPTAPIERMLLRTCPDGEQFFTEMRPAEETRAARWWQAPLRLSMPLVNYRFLLFTTDGPWWYNATGLHRHTPTDLEDFRLLVDYAAPVWLGGSVFYQIFPDRFANGDPANDVRDNEYTYRGVPARHRTWGEKTSLGGQAMVEFFGGDLPGIQNRLDYLESLGINAIYLNPIFSAYSNHRYDVIDYENVDPHLGGNPALAELRRATTERGMRYLLDIVPNHCGVAHPWFQVAQADPHRPTAEFFTFHHHPHDYACWLGVKSLPKLNYRSAALREAMYAGENSIFRRWLKPPYAADGWRIDVANMLGRLGPDQIGLEVGRGIRQAVKEENPQAYLLGEDFFDASHQLQGDCWDGVMNYAGFAKPLWYWLRRFSVQQHAEPRLVESATPWSTQALVDSWQAYRAAIPWQIAIQQFNQLGSHDTQRILSLLEGDPARNRLAVALLFTYVGVPCIYYGDEIGLLGGRECMIWEPERWDTRLQDHYRSLIRLRKQSTALQEGGLQMLAVEEDSFAYLREAEDERVIVVANRGPQVRPAATLNVAQAGIEDGWEFTEWFSGRTARVANGGLPLADISPGAEIWLWRQS